ncbi:Transcriptional regulator [Desulfitobacterium hafniense]|uniref:Transcriptional regulator n=1 Tax=Desulfitobacterium hafniense TaxID=49338 RepID=A0A098B0P5_DESHA|nr:TetR/AcrR family transcriptional regulator [Desulfitobacterium hafniense]CDX01446.1 Transcriptional regulator [Desulfitobacterium hafniense]
MQEYHEVQWRIFHTLGCLLEKTNLDSISTKQLCEESHVSRQTFYRYFHDKYSVVNWHFDLLAEDTLLQIGRTLTWLQAHVKLFAELYKERSVYVYAAHSEDYNAIGKYAYRRSRDIYTGTLTNYIKLSPTKALLFQIDAAALLTSQCMFIWGEKGMREPPEELAALMDTVLPPELKEIFDHNLPSPGLSHNPLTKIEMCQRAH